MSYNDSQMMLIVALLVSLVKLPFLAVVYLAKNKALVLVVVAVVVAVVLFNVSKGGDAEKIEIPEYQKTAPSFMDAPRVIRTASRVFYVGAMIEGENTVTMTRWFDYNSEDEGWKANDRPVELQRDKIKIYERRKGGIN